MYKVRPTEAWYRSNPAEQEALLKQVDEALDEAGGKRVVDCNSQWASDRWMGSGVEEFPSLEAQQKHTELLSALNWFRYIDADTLLGTKGIMS
jgi:hypothetical protein